MQLRRYIAASAFATCLSVYADEFIAFKSTNFGVSVEQFLQLNPEFRCPSAVSEIIACRSTSTTYAGLEAKRATAVFLQGKLSHIELSIIEDPEEYKATFAFATIDEALISKYGQPRRDKDNAGSLKRILSIWKYAGLSIQLSHSKNDRTNLVGVMIGRDDHWQRSVDLHKAKAKGDI